MLEGIRQKSLLKLFKDAVPKLRSNGTQTLFRISLESFSKSFRLSLQALTTSKRAAGSIPWYTHSKIKS